jgi:tape measure domain-containing protein
MAEQNIVLNVIDNTARGLSTVQRNLASLNKGLLGVNRLAALAGAAIAAIGAKVTLKGIIETSTNMDKLKISLSGVEGSAEKGAVAFNIIRGAANKTIFTTDELGKSYTQLRNAGIYPNIALFKEFSNVAAISTNKTEALEEITKLYSKAMQGGGVEQKSLNKLAEMGIPVFDVLGKRLGMSREQIVKFADSAEGGRIVLDNLAKGLGERFGNATNQFNNTLAGSLAELQKNVSNVQQALGDAGLSGAFKQIIDRTNEFIKNNPELIRQIGEGLGRAMLVAAAAVELVVKNIVFLGGAFIAFFGLKIALNVLQIALAFGGGFVKAVRAAAAAIIFLSRAAMANPLILGATLIAVGIEKLTGAFSKLLDTITESEPFEDMTDYLKDLAKQIGIDTSSFEDFKNQVNASKNAVQGFNNTPISSKNINDQTTATKKVELSLMQKIEQASKNTLLNFKAQNNQLIKNLLNLDSIGVLLIDTINKGIKGFADGLARALVYGEKIKITFAEIAKEFLTKLISGVIELGIRLLLQIAYTQILDYIEKRRNENAAIQENLIRKQNTALTRQIALQATLAAFGGGGGGGGGFLSFLGFADGGTIPGNRPSIVGERGPELYVPRQTGTIIPNENLNMGSTTVNFNISTVDAQGFDEILLNRRNTIVGIINEATNKRGRVGATQ